ncbi:pentatricopeptide repeat-containing protein, putative [Ricinus communis]|uniref:Pentatricopeptide repeat-containing protein, putative n=1 Tax=Ricinus communis TaxID=3988 RepID=B9SJA5_RICCO|nr:pentatricopeptide repeat-containing protein, putative [Ricinus communis]
MASLLDTSGSVASNESGFAFEENEEQEVIQSRKDELDMDSFEKYLPPWGNLTVHQEPELDPAGIVQPSISPRNTISLDESRVHLLEEGNEEELSRRILMLSRSNKVRSALELFRSMEFSGLRPNSHACNSFISCLLRNKLLDHALRVFKFMKRNEISTGHTHTLILKAVADIQGCESSLYMFAKLGLSSEQNDFDVIVYNTMLSICGRVNNWVDMERIWRSMKENSHTGTEITYSLLVSIFVRCGQNELALDAYTEMHQNGIKPRDDTLQAVLAAFTKEGKWDLL